MKNKINILMIGGGALFDEMCIKIKYENQFNYLGSISNHNNRSKKEKIYILEDGHIEPGYHRVNWDASGYSSGIYFVKMISGDYISTQKLMLVK